MRRCCLARNGPIICRTQSEKDPIVVRSKRTMQVLQYLHVWITVIAPIPSDHLTALVVLVGPLISLDSIIVWMLMRTVYFELDFICTDSVVCKRQKCSERTHICHINAMCSNTPGSYTCACDTGFKNIVPAGDGTATIAG